MNQTQKLPPIIALTANASEEDKKLCINSGMNGVITKPFKRHELSDALTKWLSHNNDT